MARSWKAAAGRVYTIGTPRVGDRGSLAGMEDLGDAEQISDAGADLSFALQGWTAFVATRRRRSRLPWDRRRPRRPSSQSWIRRYILFHCKRHPQEMGEAEINAFLTHLAVDGQVSASTQTQALCALLFLYRTVLEKEVGELEGLVRAKRRRKLPVVLTAEEDGSRGGVGLAVRVSGADP